jgi:hydroxymethylpyrimidine pyrophosphatase-like HAD family hydrolase
MALRCVYTDLDGTLLGKGASLLRDGDGNFTLLGARGLEACFRAGVEVVPVSGRTRTMLHEDARLLGAASYVYELGGGMVIDGESTSLVGEEIDTPGGETPYEAIERTGAPRLLLERFAGRLEYHEPWHRGRSVTHLMRGLLDTQEANAVLAEAGLDALQLVDNGAISPKPSLAHLEAPPHAYHLLPRSTSKAAGAVAHMRVRGYAPEECIAVGDSREDLGMAAAVGRFFLVENATRKDPSIKGAISAQPNATVAEEGYGDGFYEAVVRSIAEDR